MGVRRSGDGGLRQRVCDGGRVRRLVRGNSHGEQFTKDVVGVRRMQAGGATRMQRRGRRRRRAKMTGMR